MRRSAHFALQDYFVGYYAQKDAFCCANHRIAAGASALYEYVLYRLPGAFAGQHIISGIPSKSNADTFRHTA